MTLDQMNGPAHTCIREPQRVVPRRKVADSRSSTPNTAMKSPSSVSPSQALGASIRLGLAVGDHRPRDYYEQNATLREVIDFIASGALGSGDTELFRPIVENLSITIPSYGSPITRPTSMRRTA